MGNDTYYEKTEMATLHEQGHVHCYGETYEGLQRMLFNYCNFHEDGKWVYKPEKMEELITVLSDEVWKLSSRGAYDMSAVLNNQVSWLEKRKIDAAKELKHDEILAYWCQREGVRS